ncbi:hypothetical protein [Sporosarcina newyorkensis]|uniref:hypothetical protein n=1 Tax=Sporosarcina newyorkensis TaxID=759851 RepID=UPI003CFFA342
MTSKSTNDKPPFWVTGIKTDPDGTHRYICRYWCSCGRVGRHYVAIGTEEIHCHVCGLYIDVEPAVDTDGPPIRNEHGYFYVAKG